LFKSILFNRAFAILPEINITEICQYSSVRCIEKVKGVLSETPKKSRLWFKYKLLQWDAFLNLQQIKTLKEDISPWVNQKETPINFQVYVHIYHAKISLSETDKTTGEYHLNQAIKLLSSINDSAPNVLRLIEIANLEISIGNNKKAQQTLLKLEQKFSHHHDPIFNRELYANLASTTFNQQKKSYDNQQHIFYRKKSLYWTIESKNKQQIAIAYYNFARALHMGNQYEEAEINYQHALHFSTISKDYVIKLNSILRMTEVLILQHKARQANALLLTVKLSDYPHNLYPPVIEKYHKLISKLATIKTKNKKTN